MNEINQDNSVSICGKYGKVEIFDTSGFFIRSSYKSGIIISPEKSNRIKYLVFENGGFYIYTRPKRVIMFTCQPVKDISRLMAESEYDIFESSERDRFIGILINAVSGFLGQDLEAFRKRCFKFSIDDEYTPGLLHRVLEEIKDDVGIPVPDNSWWNTISDINERNSITYYGDEEMSIIRVRDTLVTFNKVSNTVTFLNYNNDNIKDPDESVLILNKLHRHFMDGGIIVREILK